MIQLAAYTVAKQLEIFYRHELQEGNDVEHLSAVRVFIQRIDGALIPLDSTLVVMLTDEVGGRASPVVLDE